MRQSLYSDIFRLSPDETAVALLNRTIFRVLCCNDTPSQIFVRAYLPDDERPFGVSQITLECQKCKRQLQLELTSNLTKRHESMLEALTRPLDNLHKEEEE